MGRFRGKFLEWWLFFFRFLGDFLLILLGPGKWFLTGWSGVGLNQLRSAWLARVTDSGWNLGEDVGDLFACLFLIPFPGEAFRVIGTDDVV